MSTGPLFSVYVFSKSGACIYYQDFTGRKPHGDLDEQKLLFGMLFSLKRFIERTSPLVDDDGSFRHFTTSLYRLHFFQAPTGLRFVGLSDPKLDTLQDELAKMYAIYVDTCVRNPLYALGAPIACSLFVEQLGEFLRKQKLLI